METKERSERSALLTMSTGRFGLSALGSPFDLAVTGEFRSGSVTTYESETEGECLSTT